MAQNEKLFADFQRVKAESARHAANYSRYKTKYRQAIDQLGDVTRRLEEIQLRQGNFDSGDEMSLTEDADRPRQSDAPGNSRGSRLLEADTIAIAAERANLVREAARMADCLEAAQAERDRMALADKERVAEIAARKNEIENLRQDLQGARARVNELNARGDELEAAANRENAKLAAEIESLRQQLAELASDRDVVQAEKDGLREYIAALRVSLDRLEERHRSEFDRLMSEHEELREQYQRLTAEKAGLDRACRQNQERYDELLRAYRALEARHHSSQSHTPSPSSSSSSSVTYSSDAAHVAVELKAARSQIQALTDKVEVLERNKRRLEVLVTALGIELK
jgi:chromosome segregation ATPase